MNLAASVSDKPKRILRPTQGGSFYSPAEIAEQRVIGLEGFVAPILDRMSRSPVITHPKITGRMVSKIKRAILDVLGKDAENCIILPNDSFHTISISSEDPRYIPYQTFHEVIVEVMESVSDVISPNEEEYHKGSIGIFGINNMVDVYCSKNWFNTNFAFVMAIQKIQETINNLIKITDKGIDMITIDEISYKASQLFEQDQKSQVKINKLQQELSRDRLTQIANRLAMEEQFEQIPKDADSICLLILDIDNFKNVNTTYGHNGGDRALISFASILTIALRHFGDPENFKKSEFFMKSEYFKSPENILGYERSFNINNQKQKYDIDGYYPDFSVHRLGGEEFVIILNGVNPLLAKVFAEFVRSEIETTTVPMPRGMIDPKASKFEKISPVISENPDLANSEFVELNITASIGLAQLQQGQTLTDLLHNADKALYDAKNNGKNQVVEFGSEPVSSQGISNVDSNTIQLPKGRRKGERGAIPGIAVQGDNFIERRTHSRRSNRMGNLNEKIVHSFSDLGTLYCPHAE